jgi:hypothetical protein
LRGTGRTGRHNEEGQRNRQEDPTTKHHDSFRVPGLNSVILQRRLGGITSGAAVEAVGRELRRSSPVRALNGGCHPHRRRGLRARRGAVLGRPLR